MRTFLDDNRVYGSTFLIYGNVNDDFYCPDATIQNIEQYLVSLLKKRGYEHIIFFGTGTRGAYCRDAASARFFFSEANQGVPQVEALRENGGGRSNGAASTSAASAASGRGSVGSAIRSGKKRRKAGYNPGALSGGGNDTPAQAAPEPQNPPAEAAAPVRIHYALRNMRVGSFYTQVHDKMLDRNSRMAIVFYNVLTDCGNQNSIFLPSMRDDILSNFSQAGDHNLCLIVAPDTMVNTCDLQNLLRSNGLGGKFLKPASNYEYVFNPECCFQIGYPGADEIKNMLHRFAVVGTSCHKRIALDYGKLDELAERILANAALDARRKNISKLRMMKVIADKLEKYIHANAQGTRRVEITADVIDDIWNIHTDPQEAIQKLRRKGWEEAYEKVKRAVRSAKNAVRNVDEEPTSQEHIPDIGLARYAQQATEKGGPRAPIPNFVLLGHPGTGKSEISRLIGQVLFAEGILKVGHTREVKQEDLTSPYQAGIPKETIARVDEAEEGVLFIDEAHSLGIKDGGVNSEGSGIQVVRTLVGAMTDPNRHFCTILSGYPEHMQSVFDLDPGFTRRFTVKIRLDDYKPDLLYEILLEKIRDCGYEVSPELTQERAGEDGKAYVPLRTMVDRIYAERDREKFGNASDMKTLAEYATGMHEDGDCILHQENFYGGLGKVTSEYFVPMNLGMTKEKIFATMEKEYVGMNNVKRLLRSMALSIERTLADGKTPDDIQLEPILLVGNPGTGKTVVAETLAQLYYSYGLLGSPESIRCNASEIVSPYAGDTAKVTAEIKRAQDRKGFLFVDEAHNLNSESLKAFMAPLTDRKKPFVACFAVYTDEKEKFLALDPGSRSRFAKNIIHLDDYTPDEMYEIFVRAMEKQGYTAEVKTLAMVKQLMKREYETRTTQTGNARHVLNILSEMRTELDYRCSQEGIPFSAPESRCFKENDIPERYRKGLSAGDNASRLEELAAMEQEIENYRVGNAELKTIIKSLLTELQFQLKFPQMATGIIEPGHYFFKGNAGTGKSTSLDYLGDFLFRMGIIKDPTPVSLSASRLVGQYLGETAVQTRTLLEQNMGRLILIDEAYALADPNDRANSYKRDAINEIVAKLDDPVFRKTTCVVFAGYEGDMDGLYRENQGLRSRVKEVAFPDFTYEECVKILQSMLEDRQAPVEDQALALCCEQIAFLRSRPGFSNGRTLRNYANVLAANRKNRMLAASVEEMNAPDLANIQVCDIPALSELPRLLNL